MASVKRFPESRYWYACFTLPNNERRQVSTRTENREEAMQIAATYEKASTLARQKRWNQSTARRILREIGSAAGYQSDEQTLTVGGFLTERGTWMEGHLKGRTLEKYRYALTHFAEKNPATTDLPLGDLMPADAVEWRDALRKEGLAKATINHQLAVLRQQWKEAKLKGLVDSNPFDGVAVTGKTLRKQERRAFSFDQFESLLKALHAAATGKAEPLENAAEWYLLVKLAAYSGQREGDCAKADRAALDAGRRVWRFQRGKNKDEFEVPIHPSLWPDLERELKKSKRGPLLPALAASPPTGRNSLSDTFRQVILPRIGIVQPYATAEERGNTRGRKLAAYSFHSLRHSLSTWLNDAEVSDVDRARIVGHDDKAVSRGYTHAGLRNAKRALAKVPRTRH